MNYIQGNLNFSNLIMITDSSIFTLYQGVPEAATIDDLPNEVTDGTITLKWSEPKNNGRVITQYIVYQRIVSDGTPGEWFELKSITDASVRELKVELEDGKVYEFVVTATNFFGESLKGEEKIMRVKASGGMCRIYISLKFRLVHCYAYLTPNYLIPTTGFYTTRYPLTPFLIALITVSLEVNCSKIAHSIFICDGL